ncbi:MULTISPECIES: response regulator [unclassified Rhodanobacter]|jgi:CheY-like chemotaxis protein|uniref:response regulator n=1 Tax=unclassified Rhodanobacter TaxID=2621553 RepID=UPI001607E54B|nr:MULTISPECIES: response regulator [unclassified Rhodanobacter]MBB6241101.1 CheY-like chemotaxis protein [Rhodanobacter sp. MP1X3]MBB6248771.1 CheY-like chemotaxis protein [Rhodanobacter sp. A1T4]
MSATISNRLITTAPRVLVVDGSRVVRQLLTRVLLAELPDVEVIGSGSGADALQLLENGAFDFITIALRLPDMDGLELARAVRETASQTYVPIVVVSGDVDDRLHRRSLGEDVTDYFDKALGLQALAEFIRGYVSPQMHAEGTVLYVEDSRVVALATRRMLEKIGLTVRHVVSVEDALAMLETDRALGWTGADVVLTDVSLKGELTGGDLLERIRNEFGYGKGRLPVLVMTGDENPANQAALIKAGANDLVEKPVEEKLLITKLLFQLRVAQHLRSRASGAL